MKTSNAEFSKYPFIDLLDPLSVDRWTNRLGLTERELKAIVLRVGGDAEKVQKALSSRKIFPAFNNN